MIEFSIPFPPSVNQITAVVRGRKITSKRGRQYRDEAVAAIRSQYKGATQHGRLSLYVTLYPPCRRKRDIDNYSKGILDAITAANVWADDELVDDIRVVRGPVTKGGACLVRIENIDSQAA